MNLDAHLRTRSANISFSDMSLNANHREMQIFLPVGTIYLSVRKPYINPLMVNVRIYKYDANEQCSVDMCEVK